MGQSKNFTLMMLHSDFLKCTVRKGAKGYLRFLPTNLYGPSEVTWYTEEEITRYPGVVANRHGTGKTVYLPWMVGSSYGEKGNYAQRSLFLGCLNQLLEYEASLVTDAPAQVEMTHLANRNGAFEWIGMINHTGFHGTSVREPVPVHHTAIRFMPVRPVKELWLLRSDQKVPFKQKNGWVECTIPEIMDFEMLVCLYK